MKKVYLYPLWLRIWHVINALCFLVLIVSGISLHFSDTSPFLLSFDTARLSHNTAGILLSVNFAYYTLFNIISGNWKYYIPNVLEYFPRSVKQVRYYLIGIFRGEPHPFGPGDNIKFNPLQQIAYLFVIFVMVPIVIFTGLMLMFPELSPGEILGMGGVWPMAILHIIIGFFLSLFMFSHIYLSTTGHTLFSNFKSILNGWHELHDSQEMIDNAAKEANDNPDEEIEDVD
ncbi:MAG: cytochrome b/b6 domain-containing protein [Candidatus Kapabacteria bacterium]|nr:cytochrome b/b6 domain-containing protein [Candidatus Kapabacteria bacterium]